MPLTIDIFSNHTVLLLYNVSPIARSSDFRLLLRSEIEENIFACFHYRHRTLSTDNLSEFGISVEKSTGRNFAFCLIKTNFVPEFYKNINNLPFMNMKLKIINLDEYIRQLDEQKRQMFLLKPEFSPPSYLPNGNVGTPWYIIMEMISLCKIPASVLKSIKKIEEPCFKQVSFDYRKLGEYVKNEFSPKSSDCEDWERHIQLHNDVTTQERTEERPFETEKEIVWEKGSSGLVHYTDVQHWNEKAGKNVFDEDTVDDWDVDMAIYTDPEAADRDAREMLAMREVEAARNSNTHHISKSISTGSKKDKHGHYTSYAAFEKYTTRFGSKHLIKSGWVIGEPLGKGGLIEPIQCESRQPSDKSGLGYFSGKQNISKRIHYDEDYIKISTIYDEKNDVGDTPLQSAEPTHMKYRSKFDPK